MTTSSSASPVAPSPEPVLAETLPATAARSLAAASPASSSGPPKKADSGGLALREFERLSALLEREVGRASPAAAPAAASAAATEDEELESYLGRFMERVTGKKSEPTVTAALVTPVSSPAAALAGAPEPPPPPRAPVKPPEQREQLTAMRDLANYSAQLAVSRHATSRVVERAQWFLAGAAGTSLASSGLAAAALALHSSACLWGAVGLGLVAAAASWRFFRLCGLRAAAAAE